MLNHKDILHKLRSLMKAAGIDFFIAGAADEYLNEYSEPHQNTRYIVTGFSGTTGDALVTQNDVFLFVDGRYHIQAENETDKNLITIVKLGMDISPETALTDKIKELASENHVIGFISAKISYSKFKKLSEALSEKKIKWHEFTSDPVLELVNFGISKTVRPVRHIPISISGISASEKFDSVRKKLDEDKIDLFILTKLEEIAYISNLRGSEIPYNSTFKAKAVINHQKCFIFTNLGKILPEIREKLGEKFEFKDKNSFEDFLENIEKPVNIGFNPDCTNLFIYRQLEATQNNLVEMKTNPIAEMKAVKNPAELNHMQFCFEKTDIVVNKAISWLNQNLENKIKISEKDFSDRVKEIFLQEGAYDLSFEVIAASGKNTAIIHYTHPDPEKYIETGELVLLDCGAYFEGGYATDITRTVLTHILISQILPKAKEVYTKVLRAFLHGLNYDVQENTTGFDIDKKVRQIIMENTEESFKFPHGTGHGVGISVHESPPRLGTSDACKTILKPGMCFTIEPGLYNSDWGGVRLENTVTIIKEPENKLKIKSLTRSKFDENLIDYNSLSEQESNWLAEYQKDAAG